MNLFTRYKLWWQKESLKHDRDMINRIFSGYGEIRREAELRRLIKEFYEDYHLHHNPTKLLMGGDWKRSRYTEGEL